jgi:tRNA modification GTPase
MSAVDLHSTILAIASPPGRSARGIVRISGPGTLALLDQGADDPGACSGARRMLIEPFGLPCLALLFRGPRSYTGDDSAELQLPGNPALLERVIDGLLARARRRGLDARRAGPGEFTARAFLNGRLTLTQAEGVAATIAARSDAELRAAALLRSGRLGSLAESLADRVAAALALVEAGIDFTDQDDVIAITPDDLRRRLQAVHDEMASVLKRAVPMEHLEAIPWVVLAGPPNAGKSTLFNALLGRERAVVSPTAGTTRDVLAEPLKVPTAHGEAEVMLIDLAGLDESNADPLHRLMQAHARRAMDRAELTLVCVPPDAAPAPAAPRQIVVRTKADGRQPCSTPATGTGDGGAAIVVSARTGAGLAALRTEIGRHLTNRAVSLSADAAALSPRHEAALRSACEHVSEALLLLQQVEPAAMIEQAEMVAALLRTALDDLGSFAGRITPDDVLGRVFASFCIGK